LKRCNMEKVRRNAAKCVKILEDHAQREHCDERAYMGFLRPIYRCSVTIPALIRDEKHVQL
jgi:hypothetical protein